MKYYDFFNGDADGIISLHQFRLQFPRKSEIFTGVKRDVKLLRHAVDIKNATFTVFDISIKLGMVKKSFFGSLKPTKRQIGWCAGFIDATLQSNNVNDEENRFTTEYIFALVFNNNSYFKDLSKNQDSYHPYMLEGANAYRLFMDSVNLENKKQPIMPPYE